MGWIHRPTRVLVTFIDAKGNASGTAIRLPPALSFADAGDFGEAYATALEAASDAKVTGIQIIGEAVSFPFIRPASTSNNSRVGTLIFGTGDPAERWILELPSLRTDLLMTTGPYAGIEIDLTLPDVAALASAIIDGDGTVSPTGLTGNDIASVITGLLRIP